MKKHHIFMFAAIILLIIAGILAASGIFSNPCKSIKDQQDRNFCYRDAAIAEGNPKICSKMNNYEMFDMEWCIMGAYKTIAVNAKNISICDSVQNEGDRSICYMDAAKEINDSEQCFKINDLDDRDNCLQDIAKIQQDTSICDKMRADNQVDKDSCYWNIAWLKNDISVCDKIPVYEDKELCRNEIILSGKNSTMQN